MKLEGLWKITSYHIKFYFMYSINLEQHIRETFGIKLYLRWGRLNVGKRLEGYVPRIWDMRKGLMIFTLPLSYGIDMSRLFCKTILGSTLRWMNDVAFKPPSRKPRSLHNRKLYRIEKYILAKVTFIGKLLIAEIL